MNDCKEAITIPDGCYATIEGNKVVFRKWAYPIPRALEVAALHWRMNNSPSSRDTIGAFVSGAEWQKEQLEKNRLAACDSMTKEEFEREQKFTTDFIEKNHRIPTYSDAIEYGRNIASEQAMKYLQEHHSPSEASDFQAAMNIAVAKAIDNTINKSIEWLKNNIHYDDFRGNMEWYVPFEDDKCMIQHFKTYMEE